ncbi:MAG: sugar transferase [Bacilli bacterium]|nr:sugar transferase [Bacilli bacterium]
MFDESISITANTSKIKSKRYFYYGIKRLFDIIVSGIAIIVLLPFFIVIAILIKLDSKGTIFYKHKRIGKRGQYIYLYKFRTMYKDSNERLVEMLKDPTIKEEWETYYKLNNDPRITRIGKFLRKTSIDELPQLLNIFNGEMSFVGPRPIIDGEIEKYGELKNYFLSVTPGLTGWWAVNGRSAITYTDRKRLELYYIKNQSIKLDIKIILKTFITVFKRNNVK